MNKLDVEQQENLREIVKLLKTSKAIQVTGDYSTIVKTSEHSFEYGYCALGLIRSKGISELIPWEISDEIIDLNDEDLMTFKEIGQYLEDKYL